ncbi:MAG: hypothetical protein WCQ77_03865 [Planctomycetota bacterium]
MSGARTQEPHHHRHQLGRLHHLPRRITGGRPVAASAFVATSEEGPINKLTWQTVPAEICADGMLFTPQPRGAQRGFFFTVTTTDGLQVSSPAVIVPEP